MSDFGHIVQRRHDPLCLLMNFVYFLARGRSHFNKLKPFAKGTWLILHSGPYPKRKALWLWYIAICFDVHKSKSHPAASISYISYKRKKFKNEIQKKWYWWGDISSKTNGHLSSTLCIFLIARRISIKLLLAAAIQVWI